ncbi:MAG: glutathione S-transferase family protein [Rhizobiales bacterium]|nr:glutathione S-transferase family protein [Hyphomicrobiales bacterium]
MSNLPQVYGKDFSVYVQVVRLTLAEKGIEHQLVEVNPFDSIDSRLWYFDIHPFGRMPAFIHNDVRLYESEAIARYIDEAYDGPILQPGNALARARMTQAISILQSYAYLSWVWGIYMHRIERPKKGLLPDKQKIASSLPDARAAMKALSEMMSHGEFLAGGDQLTLADLFCAPMMNCLDTTPEGIEMLGDHQNMARWWDRMRKRASVKRFVL